jgi:hypothetical protein
MGDNQDSAKLLADLAQMGSLGHAENEPARSFPRTFQPVIEHIRAFDPIVSFITGPRGSGKTELYRAIMQHGLFSSIQRCLPELRPPLKNPDAIKWIAGYPIGIGFPDELGLARFFFDDAHRERVDLIDTRKELWFAYLARILWNELSPEDQSALERLHEADGGDIEKVYSVFRSLGNKPLIALDHLNSRLEQEDRYVIIGYDDLDKIVTLEWVGMLRTVALEGLLGFWAVYSRRWRRIRPKLFLPTELFNEFVSGAGPDLERMAANRVELFWSERSLYAMLLKRIANKSEDLWQYIKDTGGVEFLDDPVLGYVPKILRDKYVGAAISLLAGPSMGVMINKGQAYQWLLSHIKDGRGRSIPRILVRMIEVASELQSKSDRRPVWPRLIDSVSLRRAFEVVSIEHVRYCEEEWPWLGSLRNRLRDQQVPFERDHLERLLEAELQDSWDSYKDTLPAENMHNFIDYLIDVGVFMARTRGRIDVPDLFLVGLG